MPIYLKKFGEEEGEEGWVPVKARLKWLHPNGYLALFSLKEQKLEEKGEFKFSQPDSLLIAVWEGNHYKVRAGVSAELLIQSEEEE